MLVLLFVTSRHIWWEKVRYAEGARLPGCLAGRLHGDLGLMGCPIDVRVWLFGKFGLCWLDGGISRSKGRA